MKKWIAALVTLLALLALVTGAMAAGRYPTDPNRKFVRQMEKQHRTRTRSPSYWFNENASVEVLAAPGFDGEGRIRVDPGTEYEYSYTFQVYFLDLPWDEQLFYYGDSETAEYTIPRLYLPGRYEVTAFAVNLSDEENSFYIDYDFTLEADAAHLSLDDLASQIVSQCRGTDDWHTALNLHDWLTHHACYDETYSFYGPDGVLAAGTGVCDSYSKAYNILMRKAGINCIRIDSDPMWHAWNQIQLNGRWYHVDVTWDDPISDAVAVSGQENQEYFCLSDECIGIMDPPHYDWTGGYTCSWMDANYVIHEGQWASLDNWRYFEDGEAVTGTYSGDLQGEIDRCRAAFDIPMQPYIADGENSWTYYDIERYYLAYGLAGQSWTTSDGESVTVWITPDLDAGLMHVKADPGLASTGTLTLPSDVEEVQAQAFENVLASEIVVPEGCTGIGPRAFSGANLRTLYIPASVTEIDDSAFEGCRWLIVVAPAGSAAASLAESQAAGVVWQAP